MHIKPPRKKFVLRLPPDIHTRLATAALNNRRSMNAEIIHRLENALSHKNEQTALAHVLQVFGDERHLLTRFQRLAPEKRIAVAALLDAFDL